MKLGEGLRPVAAEALAPTGGDRPGMTEGELLGIAGEPDLRSRDRSLRTYTYMPTPADPFTTTILLVRGRVHEIERERKF